MRILALCGRLMHSTDLALTLTSVIFESGSSDLQFLCNEQTFLSLSTVIIALPSSTMLFLMHSTDLASSLKSHLCSSYLHCARFWIGQTLFFLSIVINAHLCSCLFVICISQILLAFSIRQFCKLEFYFSVFMHYIALPLTLNSHYCASGFFCFSSANLLSLSIVIIAYPSSILLYLCISQVCLSLSTVIIAHLSSILLFFSLRRPCYRCQQLSMLIQASFCSFLHCIDLALTLNGQFCKSELYSVVCMHCTNLAVTLRSECCSSKLHSANSCIAQTLLLLSVIIDAHPRSILLF